MQNGKPLPGIQIKPASGANADDVSSLEGGPRRVFPSFPRSPAGTLQHSNQINKKPPADAGGQEKDDAL